MLLNEVNIAAQYSEFENEFVSPDKPFKEERVQPEARTFGIPTSIWTTMFASYAVFFMGLFLATGHDKAAIFMIVVSVLYTAMYFGTAYALDSVSAHLRAQSVSQWKDGVLDTFTGPMSYGSVFGQMLIVPILLAFFGVAIAIIRPLVAS